MKTVLYVIFQQHLKFNQFLKYRAKNNLLNVKIHMKPLTSKLHFGNFQYK